MLRSELVGEAKRLVDRIAETPRGAGSPGEARARGFCGEYLARAGFAVTEEEFSYSALPGRWAVPLFGLISLMWFAVLGLALAGPAPELAVRGAIPLLALLPILYFGAARMIRHPRYALRSARNLVAVRGGAPRLWLMAHLDSKSQPVPMLVRIGGIVLAALAMALAIIASFIPGVSELGTVFWLPVTVAGVAGSLAMALSTVGNRSRGALDNATGVAAAMLTAVHAPPGLALGVLLTSGEELGLAGAWAWVREQASRHVSPAGRSVINFDGLDDAGTLTCMSEPGEPLAAKLKSGASESGTALRVRRVLPGIMVDASALAKSGWSAVTISKGNFSTLARIHTASDVPERLTGSGVAAGVELVTNFIEGEV